MATTEREALTDIAHLIVRDCCELDPADTEHPSTLCIRVEDLQMILHVHLAPPAAALAAPPVEQQAATWCSACGCGNDVCGYAHLHGCLRAATPSAPAPQAGAAIVWPTMPPGLKQSAVLFEDGYAEGWAKCLTECKKAVLKGAAEPDMRAGDPRNPIRHPRIHDGYVAGWNARGPQPSQDAERYQALRKSVGNPVYCAQSTQFGVRMIHSAALDDACDELIVARAAQAQGESKGGGYDPQ